MACEFCEMYETNKRLNADLMTNCSDIKAEVKVGLVVEHYRDGYCVGQFRDKPVELIFCPQCGKKLVENDMTDFSLIFNKGYVEFEDGITETIFFYGIDSADRVIVRTRHNQYRADDNDKVWKFSWYNPERRKYEYRFDIKRIFIKEEL